MSRFVSAPALLVAMAAISVGCRSARPAPSPRDLRRTCYAGVGGPSVYSTLVSMKVSGGERLVGLTELGTGERLVEEATIDESGRLVDARATVTGAAVADQPAPVTLVAFEPAQGAITATTPDRYVDWRVPNDLPWVWLPLLTAGHSARTGAPGPVVTPLGAWVAFRAAQAGQAVRVLDFAALEDYTLARDQLVVSDGASGTVVLGDDFADVDGGKPRRLHLAALDSTLEILDPRAPSSALVAALRCAAPSGSSAP